MKILAICTLFIFFYSCKPSISSEMNKPNSTNPDSLAIVKLISDRENTITTLEMKQKNIEKGNLLVRADRKTAKILYDDIIYIESLGDYVKIFRTSRQVTITREKISSLNERLPSSFLRIHRSFIVNTDKVLSYSKELLNIDSQELPISRSFKVEVIMKLEQRI